MNKGNKLNWGAATLGIMLLFLAANYLILQSIGAEKYRGAFVMLVLNVWSGGLCVIGSGVLSAFRRDSDPIIGAIMGIGLFVGVTVLFMVVMFAMLLLGAAIAPNAKTALPFQSLAVLVFMVLPLGCLGFAVVRKSKKTEFQHPAAPYSEPAARSPQG